MKRTYNVLIIDDHQIIIDTFKMALSFVEREAKDVQFEIDDAKDCESAFKKIKNTFKQNKIDLIFLDISLPHSSINRIFSGQDLGVLIKKDFPSTKVIICTSYNDNLRLNSILKTINPDSLILKGDIDFKEVVVAIKTVLNNESYFSKTVVELLKKRFSNAIVLDENDTQILKELSNGSKMKELMHIIPLSKSGIEKRKLILRQKLDVIGSSDRDLVLAAREKGFI